VGLLAALPLLLVEHDATASNVQGSARSIGREFIRTNGQRSFWLFTLGRWACIPFSVLGAITCFAWARELYGDRSGILAATLWCFCPNILAHGQLVSHDVPAASLGLIAHFAFWRWLRHAGLTNALLAGIGLGLALLTKMTTLAYLFLWPLLWIAWRITSADDRRSLRTWGAEGAMLAAILFVAIDVLNLGYGFQGSFDRLGSYMFRSQALTGAPDNHGNRFAGTLLSQLPVPLPRPFVEGLDVQRYHLEGGLDVQATYFRGEWSKSGLPYYYLYALAIKVPLGTWCLLLLAVIFRISRMDRARLARDEFILLAPAVVILTVLSTSPGFSDHLRYALPCLPFAFIWTSRIAQVSWSQSRSFVAFGTAALVWSVLSSLWVYPHSLSYFNELVGGPRYGHYHLLSSNIDYGQDLLKLKRWYDRHPEARPLGLAYWDMESVDPHIAGIDYFLPPSGPSPGTAIDPSEGRDLGPKPGWYAVNVNFLHGDEWPGRRAYPDLGYYGYFLEFSPVARAGYSIYIYQISVDDANRVRAQLGHADCR
jgi:4-amino-4-deoxy-L-arabinose transferase-like glycosyltransferase